MFLKSIHACARTVVSEMLAERKTFLPIEPRPSDPAYGVCQKFCVNGLVFHLSSPGPTSQVLGRLPL
jgi:hypothetical protein